MVNESQNSIKNSNESKKRFKELIARPYEPVVDMEELARQNQARKLLEDAERRAKEEKIASILHEESGLVMKHTLMDIISKQINPERIAKLSGLVEMSPQKSPQPLSFFAGIKFSPSQETSEPKPEEKVILAHEEDRAY